MMRAAESLAPLGSLPIKIRRIWGCVLSSIRKSLSLLTPWPPDRLGMGTALVMGTAFVEGISYETKETQSGRSNHPLDDPVLRWMWRVQRHFHRLVNPRLTRPGPRAPTRTGGVPVRGTDHAPAAEFGNTFCWYLSEGFKGF